MRVMRIQGARRVFFFVAALISALAAPACLIEKDVFSDDPGGKRAGLGLCGDGLLQGGESCDDGNTTSGDGCSQSCSVESCFSCTQMDGGATCGPLAEGQPCSGGVCTASAHCVACLSNSDCKGTGERCFDNACVSCTNGVQDGDELGVDCGGPCLACNGTPCGGAGECKSASCVDGYCCNEGCGDICRSCKRPGKEGICGNIAQSGTDDAPVCAFTQACNGGGACLLAVGASCSSGSQCASGECKNSTCQ